MLNIKSLLKTILSKSLFKNAVYLIMGSLITAFVNFVFVIIAARLYTPEAVGLSAAAISSVGIISLISEFGLGIAIIRFLPTAGDKGNYLLNSFLILNCLASIGTTIIFLGGLNIWAQSLISIRQNTWLLSIFVIFAVTSAMQPILSNTFLAKRNSKYVVLIGLIIGILKIGFITAISIFINNTFGILVGAGLATIVGVVVSIFFFLPKVQPGFHLNLKIGGMNIRNILGYSLINYIARLLIQITPLVIPLIILSLLGSGKNSVFYICWAIASLLIVIPSSIFNSLFAEASNDANSLRNNTINSLKFMLVLILPTVLILILVSDKLLLIFGASYSNEGTLLLRILALSSIPWGITYLYISISRFEKRMANVIKLVGISTIISLGLCYFLILKMGLIGVGIGYLAGQSFSAIASLIPLKKIISDRAPHTIELVGSGERKMDKLSTVEEVVKNGLCHGCGTCVSLCPQSAINLLKNEKKGIYLPQINQNLCKNCGICFQVCPGHSVPFQQLNLNIFGKEPSNRLTGYYLNCYTSYSTDNNIRFQSSSGGLATTLLVYALEKRLVDGALVTRMNNSRPLEPAPFIARTKEQVIEAARSKYCPVPANLALKQILETDGRYAIVGLPCHLHGIRKAEQLNNKLKERIILHIGIFCAKTISFNGTDLLLSRLGINKQDVSKIEYRGNGWPGNLTIELKDKENKYIIPYRKYSDGNFLSHTPWRCKLCIDHSAELADISLGDAWSHDNYQENNAGLSTIISRSEFGDELLRKAENDKFIQNERIDIKEVIKAQDNFIQKKVYVIGRFRLSRALQRKNPNYGFKFGPCTLTNYIIAFMDYSKSILASRRTTWGILRFYCFILSTLDNILIRKRSRITSSAKI